MKNYFFNGSVFVLTFIIGFISIPGFIFSWMIRCEPRESQIIRSDSEIKHRVFRQKFGGQPVVVLFKGFTVEFGQTMAEFEVINLSDRPVRYTSTEKKGSLFYFVRFNDVEFESMWCGTGQQEYQLAPDDSIRMKLVAAALFRDKITKNGEFQVGFYLGVKNEESTRFWSEKFTISGEIRERINADRIRLFETTVGQ
jgi:hypothetical protein